MNAIIKGDISSTSRADDCVLRLLCLDPRLYELRSMASVLGSLATVTVEYVSCETWYDIDTQIQGYSLHDHVGLAPITCHSGITLK